MSTPADRPALSIERSYPADLASVWALWTTREGIESWWGPQGFSVVVNAIDLRAGGQLLYTMTATAPKQITFMRQAGMPLATETRITYTEVTPMSRLAYTTRADFVPGLEPYDVATLVELEAVGASVRMMLRFDPMHDDDWTRRARMGHEGQLGKLDALLAERG